MQSENQGRYTSKYRPPDVEKYQEQISQADPQAMPSAPVRQYSQEPVYPALSTKTVPKTKHSCFKLERYSQRNSVGAAEVVLVSGGMCIAWSLVYGLSLTRHMLASWFIGAILGAIASALLTHYIQKRWVYTISTVLVVISGILFVCPAWDYVVTIIARYLNGFASGVVVVAMLVTAGEETYAQYRGKIACFSEAGCFALGILIQTLLPLITMSDKFVEPYFGTVNVAGVVHITYGLVGLITIQFVSVESPVRCLLRNEEELALQCLRRTQDDVAAADEAYVRLDELRQYVATSKKMNFTQCAVSGLPALLKLCIYRGLAALSFSMLLHRAFYIVNGEHVLWMNCIYALLRFVGAYVTVSTVERIGRQKLLICGLSFSGMLAVYTASVWQNYISDVSSGLMPFGTRITAMILFFVFQLFAGIYTCTTSAYLSEAFPLIIKPFYIAIVFIVECLLQIVAATTIGLSSAEIPTFLFPLGVISVVFSILAYYWLPETKNTSLGASQYKFHKYWK